MPGPWEEWVHEVVAEREDDAFVTLLKHRLSVGERVVRVEVESPEFTALPTYRVLLGRGSALSELRLPHSESFTRWSFATGTRMSSVDDEVLRFGALLAESFAPIFYEVGSGYFQSILFEIVSRLKPPQTIGLLERVRVNPLHDSSEKARRQGELYEALTTRARALVADLKYSEPEAAKILDRALAGNADKAFNLSELQGLWEE